MHTDLCMVGAQTCLPTAHKTSVKFCDIKEVHLRQFSTNHSLTQINNFTSFKTPFESMSTYYYQLGKVQS